MTKKIMTYRDYLQHMQSGNCYKHKIYTCPLNCEQGQAKKKMSYNEFVVHIKTECKKVLIECTRCNQKSEKSKWRKHQPKTCLSNLSKGIQKTKNSLKLERQRRKEKLRRFEDLDGNASSVPGQLNENRLIGHRRDQQFINALRYSLNN